MPWGTRHSDHPTRVLWGTWLLHKTHGSKHTQHSLAIAPPPLTLLPPAPKPTPYPHHTFW